MKERVVMQVSRVWKGPPAERIEFIMFHPGGDHADWIRPVPTLSVGEEWIVFLKKQDDFFFPFAGTNGLLRVDGQKLIRNNYMSYNSTMDELEKAISSGGQE